MANTTERASARTHSLAASDPKPEPNEDAAPEKSGTPHDDDSTFDDGTGYD